LPQTLIVTVYTVTALRQLIVVILRPESIGPAPEKPILVNKTIPVAQEWTGVYTDRIQKKISDKVFGQLKAHIRIQIPQIPYDNKGFKQRYLRQKRAAEGFAPAVA
jgi:hypothetical protein